jgi:DNA-binding FadR family transcriptional regulator
VNRPLKPVRAATKFDTVYDALLERLETGEGTYAPGSVLPAASSLAAQFSVSGGTVARVVRALIADGWLIPGGSGYTPRVSHHRPTPPDSTGTEPHVDHEKR